jgi:hypothetical protein
LWEIGEFYKILLLIGDFQLDLFNTTRIIVNLSLVVNFGRIFLLNHFWRWFLLYMSQHSTTTTGARPHGENRGLHGHLKTSTYFKSPTAEGRKSQDCTKRQCVGQIMVTENPGDVQNSTMRRKNSVIYYIGGGLLKDGISQFM